MAKSCKSCRHWGKSDVDDAGSRECNWPPPPLPYWAFISTGYDHQDITLPEDGQSCWAHEYKG